MSNVDLRRLVRHELHALLDDQALDAEGAARFLGISTNSLYDYAGQGLIPHRRVGRRLLFAKSALIDWLRGDMGTEYP